MAKIEPSKRVERINERLKAAGVPVRVRLNGKVLGLRATLPLKPGLGEGRKQQDIRMGIPASDEGLRQIEREAYTLGDLLAKGQFSWDLYSRAPKPAEMPVSELVERFREHYLQANDIQPSTWKDQWQRTFKRLPQNEPLSESAILAAVHATEPHSETRKRTCNRLQRLADYAGLKVDLSRLAGSYGYRSEAPRDIPDDKLIEQWRDRIPNKGWRWVYGMIAAFGLRPSEAFFCEFIDPVTLRVTRSKTGPRIVRAIPPEWVERWNLMEIVRPKVTGADLGDYGDRNKKQFKRYGVPFEAYDLRHAYAIRGSVINKLPVSTMAAFMGHSATTHTREYHQWLTDAVNEEVYNKMILGSRSIPEMPT